MTLVKYIFKKFFPLFIGSLLFFAFVLVLVDLFLNLWNFISNAVSAQRVFTIMILYFPKAIWYSAPLSILFAVSYTLSDFYANNELIAVFASGVPLVKFTFPILAFSFLLSFALFYFEDNLVVPTYAKKVELQDFSLNREKSLNNDKIVVMAEMGNIVYKADYYDDAFMRLYNLYVVIRNDDKSLNCIIRADSALWEENYWKLSGGLKYVFNEGNLQSAPLDEDTMKRLTEFPETFRNNVISVETVNTKQAKEYITHLKRVGLPYNEPLSIYYRKFAFPFILFIVVFLSIGLSGKTRKNVMLISLASCITAAVVYYVFQMVTMLMAKFGILSPFLGAWLPVFLFVILSMVLLKYART
ncbi:LptF/LptG family permease [Treponema pectinovorum]|uniref:LptF/LptG family permease n=1 Tax=Treponema pectinovorum TaxID=164 RepID=UPI0011C8E317|nr:LptF/LptG family permease [Treponema pectinovorum]